MDSHSVLRPPEEPYRNWLELPRDITASILSRLGAIEILNTARLVCSTWRNICIDPIMWRSIDMYNLGDPDVDYDPVAMCRYAVDRSGGDLIDINIEYFGTDDLLQYIADRSSRLKRLRLAMCYDISDEGLSEAVKKFPLLEELHVILCTSVSVTALEVVAHSCPLLRSLTFTAEGYKIPHIECNEEALVIAGNMRHLRSLEIIGNKLTNEGLQAILDGCPHLESLDLRQCFNISLNGSLGRRCGEQIKDLRHPNDPTDDYPFIVAARELEYLSECSEDYSWSDDYEDDYDYYDYELSEGSDISEFGELYID